MLRRWRVARRVAWLFAASLAGSPDEALARGGGPLGILFGETELTGEPPDESDFWTRKNLLGDLGGLRSAMAPYGLALGIVENSEVLSNVTGGTKRGVIYEGVTDLNLGFDMRPYFHWRGVFFARAYQIHGGGL